MCQNNCSSLSHNPAVIQPPLLPPPVSEPYLMERNQDGVYVITIPSSTGNEMTSSGSDALLMGSGETGSDNGLMTGNEGGDSSEQEKVYLVRVSQQGGNHTYFPLVSCVITSNLSFKKSITYDILHKYRTLS